LKIVIRNTAGSPIYEQIKEQVKAAIYQGGLKEGETLPSIRQLARDLKISVITTTRAYNDLEQEGFLASVPGKGFFVLPQNSQLIREQSLREIESHFMAALAAAKQAGISKGEFAGMLEIILKEEDNEK
jgi:GntR family transcriptional regulator